MRLLMVGAGGIGGYFGARFAAAGHDVTFVARGATLAALRERGLTVESAVAPAQLAVKATDRVEDADRPEVVVLCTKLADLDAAASQVAPIAGGALVVTTQNGVEAPDIVARHIERERIAPGVAQIGVAIKAPGVIAHTGTLARLRVGTVADGPPVTEVDGFVAAGRQSGIDIERVDDIQRALWEKFVFLVAVSGTACLARQNVGVIREDPDLRATLRDAMGEVTTVARARGVGLSDDFVDRQLAFIDGLHPQMRPSLLVDLTEGRRLEAPWLSGAVVRMAAAAGIDVPVMRTLYAALKPYLDGAPAH
ncbi:MAG TPA: 2-dehydropantoate 2-reductase [Burkholderiaceae bacterium]|nr:2-dehydropantoate 2-reductase [Burkholderiaceae bacterium]